MRFARGKLAASQETSETHRVPAKLVAANRNEQQSAITVSSREAHANRTSVATHGGGCWLLVRGKEKKKSRKQQTKTKGHARLRLHVGEPRAVSEHCCCGAAVQ
jgi:hypothetical protein